MLGCSTTLPNIRLPGLFIAYTIIGMTFDSAKRQLNLTKHGIDLADCYDVFDWPMLTREDHSEDYGEERLVSLCWLNTKVVFLVWVDDEDEPRLISCREATRYEREAYFKAFPNH